MKLYTDKDYKIFTEKIEGILEEIQDVKLEKFEPTKKEMDAVYQTVYDFIRDNKRKIYGGFAQNKMIKIKNKNDAFYSEKAIPDIDFYSPDPINDIIKLSDILHKKGFKNVQAQEAMHKGTYTIFTNFENACDISYVPKNVFYRMPFIEVDGINYVHPSFMYMDLYKMITEPYFSSFRWEKTFPRLMKLQKHYPFKKVTAKLQNEKVDEYKDMLSTVLDFLKNRETVLVHGVYAYNHLLKYSGIMKDNKLGKNYRILNVPYFDFVSTNYRKDVLELVDTLKKKHSDLAEHINVVEHYPFWGLLGYSAYIKFNGTVLAHISHHNMRCTPFKKVSAINFDKEKKSSDTIQIGCYDFILLMNWAKGFRMRVTKEKEKINYHNIMTSHLVEMRNYYFSKKNKTLFDDTLFESYMVGCVGDTVDPMREALLDRRRKYEQGKLVVYRYTPGGKSKEDSEVTYRFPNSSGNIINNPKNLRLN